MKVYVHTKKSSDYHWKNEQKEFLQIPAVGEYFAMDINEPWHKVILVVHCPFKADFDAEIYAFEVDGIDEIHKLSL